MPEKIRRELQVPFPPQVDFLTLLNDEFNWVAAVVSRQSGVRPNVVLTCANCQNQAQVARDKLLVKAGLPTAEDPRSLEDYYYSRSGMNGEQRLIEKLGVPQGPPLPLPYPATQQSPWPGLKNLHAGFSPVFSGIQGNEREDWPEEFPVGDYGYTDGTAEEKLCVEKNMPYKRFNDYYSGYFTFRFVAQGVEADLGHWLERRKPNLTGENNQWKRTGQYGNNDTDNASQCQGGTTNGPHIGTYYPYWDYLTRFFENKSGLTRRAAARCNGPIMNWGQNPFQFALLSFFNNLGDVFVKGLGNSEAGCRRYLWKNGHERVEEECLSGVRRTMQNGSWYLREPFMTSMPNPFYYPPQAVVDNPSLNSRTFDWTLPLKPKAWETNAQGQLISSDMKLKSSMHYWRVNHETNYRQKIKDNVITYPNYNTIFDLNNPIGDIEMVIMLAALSHPGPGGRHHYSDQHRIGQEPENPPLSLEERGDFRRLYAPIRDEDRHFWKNPFTGSWFSHPRYKFKCEWLWPALARTQEKWKSPEMQQFWMVSTLQTASAWARGIPVIAWSAGGAVLTFQLRLNSLHKGLCDLYQSLPGPFNIIGVESTIGHNTIDYLNSLPCYNGKLRLFQIWASNENMTWKDDIRHLMRNLEDEPIASQPVNIIQKEYVNPATGDWTRDWIDFLMPQPDSIHGLNARDTINHVIAHYCPVMAATNPRFTHVSTAGVLLAQGHLPDTELPGVDTSSLVSSVGDACTNNFDCKGTVAPQCLPVSGGYCTRVCSYDRSYCPSGSVCITREGWNQHFCARTCTGPGECRSGWSCKAVENTGGKQKVCWPS